MKALELKIPPVAVALLFGVAMWGVAFRYPAAELRLPGKLVIAIMLTCVGLGVVGAGAIRFRHHDTTFNPMDPNKASSMVTTGIYRFTRNPMYLGLALVLVGWAVYLESALALLLVPVFLVYMAYYQIIPEERILQSKFGSSYEEYSKTVRRWL